MHNVTFEVFGDSNVVLVRMKLCQNLEQTSREKAIADFTESWDKTVEPLREKLTEISRQRPDGILDATTICTR